MVKIGVITGFGINADVELAQAFELAGGQSSFLPVTTLVEEKDALKDLNILAFPGGFSFGDHLGSGRVFAQLVKKNLKAEIDAFVARGGLILGVCNGFQTLVKMGVLPNLDQDWTPQTTLITNDVGVFQDRWVHVKYNQNNKSPWLKGLDEQDLPIRHGEGRFLTLNDSILDRIEKDNLVALRYEGFNPNGSVNNIAGITDSTGQILGLMPHPEAFTNKYRHPLWRRRKNVGKFGVQVLENAVDHCR